MLGVINKSCKGQILIYETHTCMCSVIQLWEKGTKKDQSKGNYIVAHERKQYLKKGKLN